METQELDLISMEDWQMILHWQKLRDLLYRAVKLLDTVIDGEIGATAVAEDRFARFSALDQGYCLTAFGRVGSQFYTFQEEQAYPVDIAPAGQIIAIATFEGRYVREQTGQKRAAWEVVIAEDWLFKTGYLKMQYEIQKFRKLV
jgi:hypothetical protein